MTIPSTDRLRNTYDHIIVGGGSAGCLIAARLSEDSACRVLLVEAGSADIDRPSIVDQKQWPTNLGTDLDWQYRTVPQPHAEGRVLECNRGKVIGGSSSINAAVWVWGHPADFDHWAADGNAGWDFASLKPIFQSLETSERSIFNDARGTSGPMRLTATSPDAPQVGAFFEACREVGHRMLNDVSGPVDEGCGTYDFNVLDGQRYSVARAFLLPAVGRPNLTVLTHAEVESLILNGTRCVGVRCCHDGQIREFRAEREVILSAGAIGSPLLLMKSGIGNAVELERAGIKVELELPGVGENLHDHCMIHVFGAESTESTQGVNRAAAHLYHRSGRGVLDAPDFEIIFSSRNMKHPGLPVDKNFVLTAALLRPLSRGKLSLRNREGQVDIDPGYLSRDEDVDVLCAAAERCMALSESTSLSRLRVATAWEPPRGDAKLREFVRANIGPYWHAVGTCSMGVGDMSVVDSSLRVHGMSNLRVADSSVMPRITTGNTLAPTLVIAERAASMINSAR